MLTTKYTWLYRGLGALGCGLVILGIFLPWATITAGKIGPFSESDSPSGWDMAYSQKNVGSSVNIAGAIFATIFIMIAFAGIGMAVMLIGRNGASFSYFLISTCIFFLVFMLFLLPYVQQYIPNTPDTSGVGAQDPSLNNTRNMIQEWKDLKMAPLGGFYLSFGGAILAYVGSRLIVADSARIVNYRKYAALLSQAHADGRVTTDEEALLAKERELCKISREEQIYIIRQTVPDRGLQDRLIEMHDKPLDVEKILRTREFETYKRSLVRAFGSGRLGQEASDMLAIQRDGLSISDADHDAMMGELVESGAIIIPEPKVATASSSPGSSGISLLPGPTVPFPQPVPASSSLMAPKPSPDAQPEQKWSGTMTREPFPQPESPGGRSQPASPPASPGPVAGPPIPPAPPAIAPPEEPGEPLKNVKCGHCGALIPIYTNDRPLPIKCQKCGAAGTLK